MEMALSKYLKDYMSQSESGEDGEICDSDGK